MRSALLALVACANSPSPLDRAPQPPEADVGTAWSTIARRAGPLDAASDQLDAFLATKNPEALEAWARAGGRWLRVPALRPISVMDDTVAYAGNATELVTANPGDDAFVEASLYLAQRMRRDGNDLLTAVSSIAIVRGVMRARPHAPAFAARYAPTDEEAIRAFEAEAMAVSRMVAWSTSPDAQGKLAVEAEPLAPWTFMATAPTDRVGFVKLLTERAGTVTRPENVANVAKALPRYADKLFGAVDDYAAWLKAADQPDPATTSHHQR